ncbi:hypothetical protein TG4357_01104 [Thalassovita gelatinovora]|uniref:Uncharacterized protein n=2 Tax=Thalassovita gelatinovora TaxID=53501 RepID=A0A0P1F839_THAGE|nr:hypothetical protein TG4357_01104 [Thalassovita gelatinovora]SEQ84304.1 hypothetical protein SAMN04488043_109146 [Thalassovita gelatinovora]
MGLAAAALAGAAAAQDADTLTRQREAYDAVAAKSVIDLQMFRDTVAATDAETGQHVTLISLNPGVGAWYLLQLRDGPDGKPIEFHLENPDPDSQSVALRLGTAPALLLTTAKGETICTPWADGAAALTDARKSGTAYAPICDGGLFLRNRVTGARTSIETATDFLRDNVWGGETIVRFVRDNFYKDSQLETSDALGTGGVGGVDAGPNPMQGNGAPEDQTVISTLLDFGLKGAQPGRMTIGQWYPVDGLEGVFASAFQPRAISDGVFATPGANRLDGVESRATGYMVAFDLGLYDIGYAVGTDHPALGWSSRPPSSVRPRGLPGPDGISTAQPLVTLGMVNPVIASRAVATFTGGFKRQHGAFKYGDYAGTHLGHHYGFIEKGVVLSKLQPDLSTLYRLTDGTIVMKTWQESDNALLPKITFARQNGVPLVVTDPATGQPVPGDRVTQWGPGNWSGSADADLRTLRAGACMAQANGHRYLIYGYFSTATPSAMARTFQAYGCNYAMLLDMNALEHTYLALYVAQGGKRHVEHLVPGMSLIEKKARGGTIIPRFIGFADNRDLFYLTRKEPKP